MWFVQFPSAEFVCGSHLGTKRLEPTVQDDDSLAELRANKPEVQGKAQEQWPTRDASGDLQTTAEMYTREEVYFHQKLGMMRTEHSFLSNTIHANFEN